jgi:hypothetical protein
MNSIFDHNDEDDRKFLQNLNKLMIRYHLCYSNIDETILRKTQQFEQEFFYKELLSNSNSSIKINDIEIEKTLDSGSAWMR